MSSPAASFFSHILFCGEQGFSKFPHNAETCARRFLAFAVDRVSDSHRKAHFMASGALMIMSSMRLP